MRRDEVQGGLECVVRTLDLCVQRGRPVLVEAVGFVVEHDEALVRSPRDEVDGAGEVAAEGLRWHLLAQSFRVADQPPIVREVRRADSSDGGGRDLPGRSVSAGERQLEGHLVQAVLTTGVPKPPGFANDVDRRRDGRRQAGD